MNKNNIGGFNLFQWIGEQKDWLTVFLSLAAISLSFISLTYQMKINTRNQEREFIKEQRSQAINVSMWLSFEKVGPENPNVTISNSNRNAIYDIFIFSVSNRSSGIIDDLGNLNKDGHDDYYQDVQYIEVLPPGKSKIFMSYQNAMGGEHSVPEMIFKDSNGETWFRNKNGSLDKVESLDKLLPKYNIDLPFNQYSKKVFYP
ncbi:hypothetical protein QUD55_08155 [Lactococcus lactis]|uniref:hypothetical protein n=1 Tax=Lactococcus lactis TaxID=1358 RepID=UPI0025A11097|nr:hypothetical protein [Lactococcus lactis]MDM7537443.1 hypothetical protein [Lactococcus lactis]